MTAKELREYLRFAPDDAKLAVRWEEQVFYVEMKGVKEARATIEIASSGQLDLLNWPFEILVYIEANPR